MTEVGRAGMRLAALVLALTLGACDKDDGDPQVCPEGQTGTFPTCIAVQACTRNIVHTNSGAVPARLVVLDQFSVPEGGRLDMTLDWTNASSVIGLYLVPADTCTRIEEFNARSCNFLVRSEPPGSKPRKVSTADFQAGNYRVLIANFSESDESAALQVVLSKGTGCPALAGAQPSGLAREDAAALVGERMEQR